MTQELSLSERLSFMKLDADAQQNIRNIKSVIMKDLPGALDRFYAQIQSYPETRKFFSSQGHVSSAKDRQINHWEAISSGQFDQNYVRAVTKVGEIHARIDLRALAQRSAEAAKEIKTLISASSQQVGQGVSLVGETGKALQSIVTKVAEIDTVISAISASTQEQASGLAQVNIAVNQMDHVVQQNGAMVEESTAAAHSMKAETGDLVQLVSRFQVGGARAVGRTVPRPASAGSTARPSPARAMRRKVAASMGGGAHASDGWEEF